MNRGSITRGRSLAAMRWTAPLRFFGIPFGTRMTVVRIPDGPDWQLSFRDRAARRSSFERLLAWDFDRVILAHEALLDAGAKLVFQRAYAWALA